MDTISDLFFVIIGTAVITASLVAWLVSLPSRWREPQVIVVQTIDERDRGGAGCVPLILLLLLLSAAILFGQ